MPCSHLRSTALALVAAGVISARPPGGRGRRQRHRHLLFDHIGDRPIAGGNALGQDHLRAIILADDPANPLNMAEHDCLGGSIIGPDGDTGNGAGYCDGIDKDGDVYFIWYRNDGDDRRWGFLGGTGKFAGATAAAPPSRRRHPGRPGRGQVARQMDDAGRLIATRPIRAGKELLCGSGGGL